MPNFDNGQIYKLYSSIGDLIYIGSTTRTLNRRYNNHRTVFRQKKLGNAIYNKHYCSSEILFEKYGEQNVHIQLIEEYPCQNAHELHSRERYWIELYQDKCVNARSPTLRKSKKLQYIIEYQKKIVQCDCGLSMRYGNLSYHKKSLKHQRRLQLQDINTPDILTQLQAT